MKSKIEVRVYAVEQAAKIMGIGAPQKDVVAKAQEIEKYIIGDAVLPDIAEETSPIDVINGIATAINAGNASALPSVAEIISNK